MSEINMKILIASDLHYRLKQFDWITSRAPEYDAVILAGDLLDISSHLDLNMQIVVIKQYLQKISRVTKLMVCSGNHDGNEKNSNNEFIAPWLQEVRDTNLFVDGDNFSFGNNTFTIFPWWDGDVTRQELAEQIKTASEGKGDNWIWIYHAPPDESSTCWVGNRFIGDVELNRWIEQYSPAVVICGHIHESPFKKDGSWIDRINQTWILNAGNNIGDVPAHINLDLESKHAEWVSLAGIES